MRRLCLFLILAVAVNFSIYAVAQEHEHHDAAPTKANFDKATVQKLWDAWCSLDPKNAAKFYGQEKSHVFYDIEPLQYHGWAEYEAGVKPVLAQWKSAKCKVNYDGQIREESPMMAWTASTIDVDYVGQDGKSGKMVFRWTGIWHKHGANWVLAHDHTSLPTK